MLTPPLDPDILELLHPDMAQVLCDLAATVAPSNLIPTIADRALLRLALEFDAESSHVLPLKRHSFARSIAADVFRFIE
jgi:hypothetical protein